MTRRHIHSLRIILLSICTQLLSISQSSAQISVSIPDQVPVGESFWLTYTVQGAASLDHFTPPGIDKGIKVLYGPVINIITTNGQSTTKETSRITYTLQSSSAGTYTIGSAKIQQNGKVYTAPAKKVQIVNAKGLSDAPSQGSLQIPDQDMYLRAVVSSRTVYKQEPVLISLYLYSRHGNLSGIDRQPPEVTDFVTKEIPMKSSTLTTERVGNRLMFKALIWQIIAYPQRDGELVIPAFGYDFDVYLSRKVESEDDYFANKSTAKVRKELRCKPISISVKPLPEGAPQGFSQLVGDFRIKASIRPSGKRYETGSELIYTLDITGEGNVSMLFPPKLDLLDDMEAYEPQTVLDDEKVERANTTIHRTLEYIIVPRTTGQHKIPAVELSFFNPTTHSYRTVKTKSFDINVAQGTNVAPQVDRAEETEPTVLSPSDIPAPSIGRSPLSRAGWAYWLLYPLLIAIAAAVVVRVRRARALRKDQRAYQQKQATKVAQQRLQTVAKLMQANQEETALQELHTALYHYIQWKFALPTAELSKSQLHKVLSDHRLPEEISSQWISLIEQIEFARYSNAATLYNLREWYDLAAQLIDQVEAHKA